MAKMEDKIDRILEEITEIKVTVARQDITLETNTESLKEHMARTAMAEIRIDDLEKHKNMVQGAMWILGVLGAVVSGLYKAGILQKLL